MLALTACAASGAINAAGSEHPSGELARNMRLVGYHDLQQRSAYQPIIHDQGERRYLYVGHHAGYEFNPLTGKKEPNGTSVVDVTDPRKPTLITHIPVTPSDWPPDGNEFQVTGAQHAQLCNGEDLPKGEKGKVYLLRNQGNIDNEVLDVTDPRKPHVLAALGHMDFTPHKEYPIRTHKNLWDCKSGIAYTPASMKGWAHIKSMRIYDLSDPTKPKFIREFGLVGTQPGGAGSTEGGPEGVHEASVYGDRVVIAYGTFDHGVVQILDREKLLKGDPASGDPMAPTVENLRYPVIGELKMPDFWGAHTAKPLIGVSIPDYRDDQQGSIRNFLIVNSEGVNFPCNTYRHMTWMVDITDEKHPFPVSNFQVPAYSDGLDYCRRGIFGPHAPHASSAFGGRLLAIAYFSGGIRIVDIRDPFRPAEVGFFLPKATKTTRAFVPPGGVVPEGYVNVPVTNNVEADDRGYVYAVDRANTGLHVLELTGEAAAIAKGSN